VESSKQIAVQPNCWHRRSTWRSSAARVLQLGKYLRTKTTHWLTDCVITCTYVQEKLSLQVNSSWPTQEIPHFLVLEGSSPCSQQPVSSRNAVKTFVFIDLEILVERGLRTRGAVSVLDHNIMACTDTILPLTKALICQHYLPSSCLC